ncbi:heat shock protein Hsp88 [Carpediemonas membranifera]|uniref:Heat shock protein Hsp88 n=1 Tax=Carpediemonas membranifera TaxID=201153 RepID=A0A8J6E6R3_9EUKA|nr:heat shock protein Hsp88 [Carpediemonas membranifera]|eukprot:KAG9389830.1 heat shock protein Hsp88 [Carpediemonas membranifera]
MAYIRNHAGLFVIIACITLCACTTIHSIDIGDHSFRIGYVKGRELDIVLNEQSKRSTRSVVSMKNGILSVGDVVAYNRFPTSGMIDFVADAVDPTGHSPEVSVAGLGELTKVHFLAALMSKASDIAQDQEGMPSCLIAPATATPAQRGALTAIAETAGVTVTGVISEPLAVAVAYAMKREFLKPEHVTVFTVGHSHTALALATIVDHASAQNISVSHAASIPLGGRDINQLIAEYMSEAAEKQGIDTSVPRVAARIQAEAASAKEKLTLMSTVTIVVEAINGEDDLIITLTRDQLVTMMQPMVESITDFVTTWAESAVGKKAGVKAVAVIPVGGSARVPAIADSVTVALEKVFASRKVKWSGQLDRFVNAEEAAAIGGAFYCASISPLVVARKIYASDIFSSGLDLTSSNSTLTLAAESDPAGQKFSAVLPDTDFTLTNVHGSTPCHATIDQSSLERQITAYATRQSVNATEVNVTTTATVSGRTAPDGGVTDLDVSVEAKLTLSEEAKANATAVWRMAADVIRDMNAQAKVEWDAVEHGENETMPAPAKVPAKPSFPLRRHKIPATVACTGRCGPTWPETQLVSGISEFLTTFRQVGEAREKLDAVANALENAVYADKDEISTTLCPTELAVFEAAHEAASDGVEALLALPKCPVDGILQCLRERTEGQQMLLDQLNAAAEPGRSRRASQAKVAKRAVFAQNDVQTINETTTTMMADLEAHEAECHNDGKKGLLAKIRKGTPCDSVGRQRRIYDEIASAVLTIQTEIADIEAQVHTPSDMCGSDDVEKLMGMVEKSIKKARNNMKSLEKLVDSFADVAEEAEKEPVKEVEDMTTDEL